MSDRDTMQPEKHTRSFYLAATLAVLVSLVVVAGLVWRQNAALRDEAQSRRDSVKKGRQVQVVTAKESEQFRRTRLTGEARSYASVVLYAKVSGYLLGIKVDKGDLVQADQIIAIIDSPELTKQYDAALADAKNKEVDAERAKYLVKSGSVSAQSAENTETAAKVAAETAASLRAQKDYQIVTAPFSGKITARYADPGALVQSAANSQTTALPLVSLSQTDRLRVYVYPDQATASQLRVGDRADVSDAARPDVKKSATVTRTSGELDPKTRTLLTEIDLDNSDGQFLPGSFVDVTLWVKTVPSVQVPAEALLIRQDKQLVGVITDKNEVQLRPVTVLESDGKTIKISSGLKAGERVGLGLGAETVDGEIVRPLLAKSK
jgi:membrane fusion protein, multidrug efflux system